MSRPTTARIPLATYRLQLHRGFTFQNVRETIAYLARLGISHPYCSPYLRARPGSTHGYDICDFSQLNPELGADGDFQAFIDELTTRGMGHILDFVPNHMSVSMSQNRWWQDVLENGMASTYARFFDIDWEPVKPELAGKVLLPFLGDHYGRVLDSGDLKLALAGNAIVLSYGEHVQPLDPKSLPRVLRTGLENLPAESKDQPHWQEFLSILTALDHLPGRTETAAERTAERQREKKVAYDRLARLLNDSADIRMHIDETLQRINGQPGQPDSFDRLHELLEEQAYRLAYWRTAFDEINYRRFFDVNELVGLRMENPEVFKDTHELVFRLIREGKIHGLRLDHVDGLFDPKAYFQKLQEEAGPLYLVAEKILSGTESLPDSWPIQGTTGYEFMNDLNRLFVDSQNAKAMRLIYERFTGNRVPFADVVYDCKRLITKTALASELNVLSHALNRLSEGDRRARDYTLAGLRGALREVVACFPVYRTYVSAAGAGEGDRQMIELALSRARRRNPAMEPSVFDFLRDALLASPTPDEPSETYHRQRLDFAMKFQQYTGPVQAKGVEDTAFYRYNVLLSLNEVGGDPQRFGGPPAQFHEANRRRLSIWPSSMIATATHDTKRGEDARARLNVLSEMPRDWRHQVFRWARLNAIHRTSLDGEPAPDRNDEYHFYQALLAAWPAESNEVAHEKAPADLVQRLLKHMQKAVKEAKVHTSWINPNEAYDKAVAQFVELTLAGPRAARFLAEFVPFQRHIAHLGMINSLAQVVLKITSPGVPDFYQGTELWDFSLVDPDNRRPVDFNHRNELLNSLDSGPGDVSGLLRNWRDGRVKHWLTMNGLRLRQELRGVFQTGEYLPLNAEGERAGHVVALARRHENETVLAIVPRFCASLVNPERLFPLGLESWGQTQLLLTEGLGERSYHNVLTHETLTPRQEDGKTTLQLAEVFATCPVAFLRGNA